MPGMSDVITEIISSMQVNDAIVHSGEPIEFQWKCLSAKDLPLIFSLKWGMAEKEIISNSPDSTGTYHQSIVLKTDTKKEVQLELIVELQDQDDSQEQIISLPPVTLKPPVIESFIVNEEIPLGSSVYLNWTARGEISFYELKIGDNDWHRLPQDTIQYRDQPNKPTCYQLRAFAGVQEPPMLLRGQIFSKNVRVYYPPYQPSRFFPTNNHTTVFALALAPDNSKFYIAGDETIAVVDPETQKGLAAIPVKKGFKVMVLSTDGTKLYVADKVTRSLNIISTQSYETMMNPIALKAIPKALLVVDNLEKLFIAVEGGIILTLDLRTHTLLTEPNHQINLTSIHSKDKPTVVNIGALTKNTSGSQIYAAHANSNIISKINTTNRLEYEGPIKVGNNPRAFAWNMSENKLYVVNSGDNNLWAIDPEKGTIEGVIPLDKHCENPESLALLMPPYVPKPLIYVTGGFKHCIVAVDPKDEKAEPSVKMTLGLNPHLLVANADGSRIYTLCADGLWSFWTQQRYLDDKKIIRPDKKKVPLPSSKLSSQPSADSQWVLNKAMDMERKHAERDEALSHGSFGMFFPNLYQNRFTLPADPKDQAAKTSSTPVGVKSIEKASATKPADNVVATNTQSLHT